MKPKLNHRIIITFSKYFALLSFMTCAAYSFYTKDSSVIIFGTTTAAGIIMNKQYNDRKKPQTDQTITE